MRSYAGATLLAGALFAVTAPSYAAIPPDEPNVSTYAGSGELGLADGARLQADFIMPAGIAVSRSGDVYVADAGAQRIKIIERNGMVSTFAGGGAINRETMLVAGGDRDGAALDARFNHPVDVTVDRLDNVYVADEYNHAIRKISGGRVSTIQSGLNDPKALTLDKNGNLYVADFGVGVRKITPSGATTLMDTGATKVTGVAVGESAAGDTLFVADTFGFTAVNLSSGEKTRKDFSSPAEGVESFGFPARIAPVGPNQIAYTDDRTNSVRYMYFSASTYQRPLSIVPDERAVNRSGGFRNGPGATALFDAPLGIAALPDGRMLVADAANKRIRELSAFDRRNSADQALSLIPPGDRAHQFRIAYVGNSYVWNAVTFRESTAGWVERLLKPTLQRYRLEPVVVPMRDLGLNMVSLKELTDNLLSSGVVDFVVLDLNSNVTGLTYGQTLGVFDHHYSSGWERQMAESLKIIRGTLEQNGVGFLAVAQPYPDELSPLENVYTETTGGNEQLHLADGSHADYVEFHNSLMSVLQQAGVPSVDLWRAFRADIASPEHRPLYSTLDTHFSPYGNEIAARANATQLQRLAPWKAR